MSATLEPVTHTGSDSPQHAATSNVQRGSALGPRAIGATSSSSRPANHTDSKKTQAYNVCNFLCGGTANAIARTTVAPFEKLRLVMQVDSSKYTSMVQCFQAIRKNEGLIGLYRGNWLNIVRIFPQGGASFLIKDYLKIFFAKTFNPPNPRNRSLPLPPTSFQLGAAATISGATSMVIVYPLDMIRGQMTILPHGTFNSVWHAVQVNTREHGVVRGLYKGVTYSVVWSAIYYGVQFWIYDSLKAVYLKQQRADAVATNTVSASTETISGSAGFVIGSIAGAVCTTVAFPFESVRRKLQLQGLTPDRPVIYRGMRHCFREVYSKETWRGLFRGLGPNLYKSPLAVAIIFSTHETLMGWTKAYDLY